MKRAAALFCGLLFFFGLLPGVQAEVLTLEGAYIFKPLKGARATAGYGLLRNTTSGPLVLTVLRAEGFNAAELHETISQDGVAKMQKLDSIRIDKNGTFELRPGANHLMLFDPVVNFKESDSVAVIFQSGKRPLRLLFPIRPRVVVDRTR